MSPAELAKSIWVKRHMAGVLAARAQQLGNQRDERARISRLISGLTQQANHMRNKLDALTFGDDD